MWRPAVFLLATVHAFDLAAELARQHPLGSVPVAYDCAMRNLAWEYAQKIQPERKPNVEVFDALMLHTYCNQTRPTVTDSDRFAPLTTLPSADVFTVFADATSGDDGANGARETPVRSLQRAVEMTRDQPAPKAVVLREGTYFLKDSLTLTGEDSGLTIQNYPGEASTISGGVELKDLSWKPYDTNAGKNVYVATVTDGPADILGLQINGQRSVRARYPNCDHPDMEIPCNRNVKGTWDPPYQYPTPDYITVNVSRMSGGSWFQKYSVGIGGSCSIYDPPISYWCSKEVQGGGAYYFNVPSGLTWDKTLLPNSPYKDASGAIFNVYSHMNHWANWMFDVRTYNATTNHVMFDKGGFQGARGDHVGAQWFIENVFEELDNNNEYYYDASSKQLYLFYNGTGAPPADLSVVATNLANLVNMEGTAAKPVSGTKLVGHTLTQGRYTFMDPHGVPSGGDWGLQRSAAVTMKYTENCVVDQNKFQATDGNGLMLNGHNHYTNVTNNEFVRIGDTAIGLWGFTNDSTTKGYDGTDKNQPRHTLIYNNYIHELGLFEKQSSMVFQAKAAETVINNNVFFNGPRACINLNDGFGGADHIFGNLIFNCVRETADHGPINSWDRQPFLTEVSGSRSVNMAEREINNNFIIGTYNTQEAVDNDDGSCYYNTHDNFFTLGGGGEKNDFGGHDNHQSNNVYGYVGRCYGICSQLPGHTDMFANNTCVLTGNTYGGFSCGDPRDQWPTTGGNKVFAPNPDQVKICGQSISELQQKEKFEEGTTVSSQYPSNDALMALAKEKLGM